MKKWFLYIALAISVITNVIVLYVFLSSTHFNNENGKNELDFANNDKRQEAAEAAVKKYVCETLYYPDSYDPVTTKVDSAFYNYMTDFDCVNAAIELIDLRASYDAAKNTYETNDWTIRFHHNATGPFLEHERKARDEAAKEMKELQAKIEVQEEIIRNKKITNDDSKFIGWQVIHRYRASNSKGVVSFGDVLFIFDPTMTKYYFRFSLDDKDNKNYKSIREVIEKELDLI